MRSEITLRDISRKCEQLSQIDEGALLPLPDPYKETDPNFHMKILSETVRNRYEASLDGVVAIGIPKPKSQGEEEQFVRKFLFQGEQLDLLTASHAFSRVLW
jgi:hypothetical protein